MLYYQWLHQSFRIFPKAIYIAHQQLCSCTICFFKRWREPREDIWCERAEYFVCRLQSLGDTLFYLLCFPPIWVTGYIVCLYWFYDILLNFLIMPDTTFQFEDSVCSRLMNSTSKVNVVKKKTQRLVKAYRFTESTGKSTTTEMMLSRLQEMNNVNRSNALFTVIYSESSTYLLP